MKFYLNKNEFQLLKDKNISFNPNYEYTEDEAFDLLDKVRDVEIFYAQNLSEENKNIDYDKYINYGNLADKIQSFIDSE